VALLIQAAGGAVPGPERWDAIWQKVVVRIDAAKTDHPVMRVEWPGVPAGLRRYSGQNISLDFKDGDLQDIFRLFADISGLNVVVYPGTRGAVTLKFKDVPWDEALDRILAPNGLAASLVGPVLEIARPEQLGSIRRFDGTPMDLDFKDVDLQGALRQIAERGGRELAVESSLAGEVTLKLSGVPWDQAFDLVVRLNGLAWKQEGTRIRVGRPQDLK
jgi:type II secretory pathway component HofQ